MLVVIKVQVIIVRRAITSFNCEEGHSDSSYHVRRTIAIHVILRKVIVSE